MIFFSYIRYLSLVARGRGVGYPPCIVYGTRSQICNFQIVLRRIFLFDIYEKMRRFGEYTSNKHNISVALDPHGMLK